MAAIYFPFSSLRVGNHRSWEAAAQSWGVVGERAADGAQPQADAAPWASASGACERSSCVNTDLSDQLVWHLFFPGFEESEKMRDKGQMSACCLES